MEKESFFKNEFSLNKNKETITKEKSPLNKIIKASFEDKTSIIKPTLESFMSNYHPSKKLSNFINNPHSIDNPFSHIYEKNKQQDEGFDQLAGYKKHHQIPYKPELETNEIKKPKEEPTKYKFVMDQIAALIDQPPSPAQTTKPSEQISKPEDDKKAAAQPDTEAVKPTAPKTKFYTHFGSHDPYTDDPARFTRAQVKKAARVAAFLTDPSKGQELLDQGFTTQTLVILSLVNDQIETAYEAFQKAASQNQHVSAADKAGITGELETVRMTSLKDKIRALVARFIIQSESVEPGFLNGNFLPAVIEVLDAGLQAYLTVHRVDIPLYDKVYEEFDELRGSGRYPQEVYLGRDGIYAYEARRAQDIARRRKTEWQDRIALRDSGTPVEASYTYMVYPRYYRDYVDTETKQAYLEESGITRKSDPIFYDTGFTGTIPEQIMNLMGMIVADREQRIRLLSAGRPNRRVRGVAVNARKEIVNSIEYNAKLDEPSTGIFQNPETGEVKPIAKPTQPNEQFIYMMVRESLVRHYYLQEALSYQPETSSTNQLDSAHHTISVDNGFISTLPEGFLADPDEFIADHCPIIKSSNGEGEYPNEMVVLLTLKDDQEIIAKKIELKKAKEAKKEYRILQRAKRSGLPTAKPVGFVEGKTDQNSSYLLMSKVEGVSGRKFEKELRKSGKYSEDKIQAIMAEISQKHEQVVEQFRETLKIDKPWRIKDLIIDFDPDKGEVLSITPIDWERASFYDPASPRSVEDITVSPIPDPLPV